MTIQQLINKTKANIKSSTDKLAALEARQLATEPKYWKPSHHDAVWYMTTDIKNGSYHGWWNPQSNGDNVSLGLVFPTEEEAKQAREVCLATQRLKEAVWVANGGKSYKFYVGHNNWLISLSNGKLEIDYWIGVKLQPHWFYCRDQDTAQYILDNHEEDLLIYLNQ